MIAEQTFLKMGRKLDLTGLSENEAAHVLQVVQRDMKLRKTEEERLSELKQELDEEGSRCLLLSRQTCFNQRCCIRCCSSFNFLLNPKRRCRGCGYNVCKSCRVYNKRDKAWLCSVCQKSRLLKTQSLEWFYTNVKIRFKRFGSAKVLKTLYKKHLTEHGSLAELTEGSVCNEGSICGSDSTFYRQSEEHSAAETLSVAMRVAEEAIDEAIAKAEFDTSTQDKQDEARYLREHRGELIEELAKTIVQKIISRRKTLAAMKTEPEHRWPADRQTDDHQFNSKKNQTNLWRSRSAFSLLEENYEHPALVNNCHQTWKQQIATPTVTSWKSVDRLDNSVLKSLDGNWIALQSARLSRLSLNPAYGASEKESASTSADEDAGSDDEVKPQPDNSSHGTTTDSNFNLREFSGVASERGDSDSEANWKPNKHLRALLKRKVPADMRKASSRRTSVIDVNFNLNEEEEKKEAAGAEPDGGKVRKTRKKRRKSKKEPTSSSVQDLKRKENHPPPSASVTPETLTSEGVTPEASHSDGDANQTNQEFASKQKPDDGEEEKNEDATQFEPDVNLDEGRKDDGRESEEDDEEMERRLYRLVAESKLSYFSSTEDELDRMGRSGEELDGYKITPEENAERLTSTQLASAEEENGKNERLAVKVCRLVNQVSAAQFSSTEDELDRAGRGEDADEPVGVEMFWTLQAEKSHLQDLACLVSASQFSSTDDELDKLGERGANERETGVSGGIKMWEGRESMEDIDMKMFDLREDEWMTGEIERNESFHRQEVKDVTIAVHSSGKDDETSDAGDETKLEERSDTRMGEIKTLGEEKEPRAGRAEEASLKERSEFQWDSEQEDSAEFDRIISSMLMMTLEDMEWETTKANERPTDKREENRSQETTANVKTNKTNGEKSSKLKINKTSPVGPDSDVFDEKVRGTETDRKDERQEKEDAAANQKTDAESKHETRKDEVQPSVSTPKVFLPPEEIQNIRDAEFYQNIEFLSSLLWQKYSAASLRSITTEVLKVLNATEELLQEAEQEDENRLSSVSLPPDMDSQKLDQQFCKLEENVYMAAGCVYSLEAELSDLEECARGVCSSTPNMELSFLEEQVAAAAAKVQQSEMQICDISARIAALKSAGLNVAPQTRFNKSKAHSETFVTLDSSRQQRRHLPAPPVKGTKEV